MRIGRCWGQRWERRRVEQRAKGNIGRLTQITHKTWSALGISGRPDTHRAVLELGESWSEHPSRTEAKISGNNPGRELHRRVVVNLGGFVELAPGKTQGAVHRRDHLHTGTARCMDGVHFCAVGCVPLRCQNCA